MRRFRLRPEQLSLRALLRRALAPAVVALACQGPTPAILAADDLETLKGLDLDELADLQVSILSGRPQRLSDSAAAVYVLTAEDIRRSGYTTVPELLRLVPGFDVARIDTAEWAIGARGFGGRFANKLLVMIDGRSVYTPLFSGVFWEVVDAMLEDIERIEVVRGPGASYWGANAVSGVVNIITKHAAQTEGGLISSYAGNLQQGIAARYGAPVGDTGYLRLFVKRDERDPELTLVGERADDGFSGSHAGLRGDWDLTPADTLMVQGELLSGDSNDPWINGGDLMLQWEHAYPSGAWDTLKLYYDRFELETGTGLQLMHEELDTFELEAKHRFAPLGRHALFGGLDYRWYRSAIETGTPDGIDPEVRAFTLVSAFIEDEIELAPGSHYLILGTKIEHNDFTGLEIQPNIRARWHPRPDSTLWAAIARAVRTPSRSELDLQIETELLPASEATGGLPIVVRSPRDRQLDSEILIAYELGYRWRPAEVIGLDVSLFYNDYDELRTLETETLQLELDPYPRWVQSITTANLLRGQSYGIELVGDWRPSRRSRVQAWYSAMRMSLQQDAHSNDPTALTPEEQFPQQQAGLRVGVDLRHDLELDLFGRFVDQLPAYGVDAYTELDVRLGWHVNPRVTLALVGRNLLNPSHREYGSEFLAESGRLIEREAFLRIEINL
ncbi:TonB-dependent receptor plug domain-containing protein [Thiorhodococcus minor]|uniref:TonB-dependent receptor n=1 Tax=Thiorhodococcus minor TaxID=57489 RepID=A0A6M0K7F8_9GAMM|nr:TonB-dependent receptor [Thiorhodococcus minor]NEV64305.1 TonB-dependent receptor [Thiorhodococcus minor]